MDDYESRARVYEEIYRMCTRQAAEYRDMLDSYGDDLHGSAMILLSAKVDAIEEIQRMVDEKAKLCRLLHG